MLERTPHICVCGDHAWVPLTAGFVTLVDVNDAELLRLRKWHAKVHRANNVYASTDKTSIRLHRAILTGHKLIDHINGNGLDNRRHNLRPATQQQNRVNSRGMRKRLSPFKGVCLRYPHRRKGWFAQICVDYRKITLGLFASAEDAARAYDAAARRHHGQFAFVNFPDSATKGRS